MATELKTQAKTIAKPKPQPQRRSDAQRQADYRVAQQQAAEHSPDGHADYFDKRISLQCPVVTQ